MEENKMAAREEAVTAAINRKIRKIKRPQDSLGNALPVSDFFGRLTFGLENMKEKLSKDAFEALSSMVQKGERLSKESSDEIAGVIKDWALSQGVTHFCHWFQPMTGLTAEKHDALIETKTTELGQTRAIERLTGAQLIQSEPDASSFPSGGMRTTFEARGYTAWDPTSPLFIMEQTNGKTLCIPSAFISFHGHALDVKTPLLRSSSSVSDAACKFLKLIGDVDVKKVTTTVGAEQEYFLIDRAFFSRRPDLVMAGRTLLGRESTRGQQFEDHYFGSISSRVLAYMQEVEQEMYKLGVPLKTRHNEVAPSQFEVAPVFEDANQSCDHNALLMDVLRKIAFRHDLVCLLHEKPFDGVNGNGKHNNWSLSTDRGENLLEPGRTPHQNLRFLAILAGVIKAVYDHGAVIRASIASPGNDHRLGANEAPPAIISVFLGQTLTEICERIEKGEVVEDSPADAVISLGVDQLPVIAKDNTDRNRTSPFAFTGNKFEFRAVGGTSNISVPISILNAAVAQSFSEMSERLEKKLEGGGDRDKAVLGLVREVLNEAKAVRFEGNNYSDEWVKEAESRGLPNLKNTAEALKALSNEKNTSFLEKQNVLSKEEITSKYNILVERYVKQIELEARTQLELLDSFVFPAAETELNRRAQLVDSLEDAKSKAALPTLAKRLEKLETAYSRLYEGQTHMQGLLTELEKIDSEPDQSFFCAEKIVPAMKEIRAVADQVEGMVSDDLWNLPKYREILFLK